MQADSDCRVRAGLGCCERCGSDATSFVAIGDEPKLQALVCPDDFEGCPPCRPLVPECLTARCAAGSCVLDNSCQ